MQKNKQMQKNKRQNVKNVRSVIRQTVTGYAGLSLGILLAVTGAIVTALLPPWILGSIVDTITAGNVVPVALVILYFAFTVLTGLTESIREGLLTVFGQKITHALRSSMMEKYTNLTAGELTKQEPGTIVSRFVGDVDTVENLFTSGIISMFADACKIISILVVIWLKNSGLAIVLLILLPFLYWFTRTVQKNMLKAQIENRRAVGRASGHVPETLHNIRTIHTLGKERYMEERYDEYIAESYRAVDRTNFYDAIYSPVILILNAIVVAVVMLFSASGNAKVLTLFGMSAGTAVAVINYISQIFTPVESLGMEIQTIQSAIAGVHRINEFYALEELPERVRNLETPVVTEEETPFVELQNVTFAYEDDSRKILHHLSFKVYPGEQVTLSGRTGAGKSTVFKLLLGLYQPGEGKVLIQGRDAFQIPENEKRSLYGYVEQTFHRVPGTVKDQITLYDDSFTMEEVREAARIAGLDATIEQLEKGYDTICTSEIFSQGQWQLLSIARAAVADPPVMILDEATSSIDTRTEALVQRGMDALMKGRTVFVIAHRLSTVQNSDAIMVLDHGNIIERGTHDDLIAKKGTYYQLYTGAFELE